MSLANSCRALAKRCSWREMSRYVFMYANLDSEDYRSSVQSGQRCLSRIRPPRPPRKFRTIKTPTYGGLVIVAPSTHFVGQRVDGVVGYRICLTSVHRRSSVRAWVDSLFLHLTSYLFSRATH